MVNKTSAFLLLGALASEVLASTSYMPGNSLQSQNLSNSLFKRSDANWVCTSDDTPSLMLTHFSAVFFGDFITNGGQDILGPLAVGGKFKADHYMVNANQSPKCSNDEDIKDYALVVGGKVDADEVRVNGNAQVPSGSTGLVEKVNTCKIFQGGKSVYDFNLAHKNALSASETLANMKPNMILDPNGRLSSIGEATDGFHVLTFSTCDHGNCDPFPGKMSYPSTLLQGQGNWNGPQGMSWPKSGTLVLNIPIDSGSTFTLLGNLVTQGMDPCRTIFNFYPTNGGKYSSGSFTLKRQTGSNLGAFVLAPKADVIDGSTGAFAGSVIGNNYSWGGSGIEIHDYRAGGGSCDTFEGCLPITPPGKTTTTTTTTTAKTSTSTSTTTTNAAATTTTTTAKTSTSTSSTTTTVCDKTTCKNTTTTSTTTACNKTTCKNTTTTSNTHHATTTPCNHHGTTTTHHRSSTTTTGSHQKTTTPCNHHTKSTTSCNHHTKGTTTCKHHTTTKNKHHTKGTTTCKHHTTTKNKHHTKSTTTTPCGCKRHSSTTHHQHSTKTTSSHHSKKTTTSHKKHTTSCTDFNGHTTCPSGCRTKTVTKVIYVTAK